MTVRIQQFPPEKPESNKLRRIFSIKKDPLPLPEGNRIKSKIVEYPIEHYET
jgi:hypothetical protein